MTEDPLSLIKALKLKRCPLAVEGFCSELESNPTVLLFTRNDDSAIKTQGNENASLVPALHPLRQENTDIAWHFYRGAPLVLLEIVLEEKSTTKSNETLTSFIVLGPDFAKGQVLHHTTKAGTLISAAIILDSYHKDSGYDFSLVGCTFISSDPSHCKLSSMKRLKDVPFFNENILNELIQKFTIKTYDINQKLKVMQGEKDYQITNGNGVKRQIHPQFRTRPNESPRQIVTTFFIFTCLLPLALSRDSQNATLEQNIRVIMFALYISFSSFCFLQTRDLIVTFPHPGFWRVIFGSVTFYTFFMLSLVMLNKESARNIIQMIFLDIGTMQDFEAKLHKNIDAVMGTCAISGTALMRQLFHCPWFLAHVLGWAGKMIIFRDFHFCLFAAFMFEVCEVTFTYVVPEFEECWWDSLFLDTLGANIIGMLVGDQINKSILKCKKDKIKKQPGTSKFLTSSLDLGQHFDWVGKEERKTLDSRLLMHVSPFSSRHEWTIFKSPQRFFQVLLGSFFLIVVEVNSFLIINSLGVPNTSKFVLFRLIILGLIAIPAGAEWFSYIENSEKMRGKMVIRLGPTIWLFFFLVTTELAVVFKFFPKHMLVEVEKTSIGIPYLILIPHLASLTLFSIWYILKFNVIGYATIALHDVKEIKNAKQILSSCEAPQGFRNSFLNFQKLPKSLKKKVLLVELVDSILLLALAPTCYLFFLGWKFD